MLDYVSSYVTRAFLTYLYIYMYMYILLPPLKSTHTHTPTLCPPLSSANHPLAVNVITNGHDKAIGERDETETGTQTGGRQKASRGGGRDDGLFLLFTVFLPPVKVRPYNVSTQYIT